MGRLAATCAVVLLLAACSGSTGEEEEQTVVEQPPTTESEAANAMPTTGKATCTLKGRPVEVTMESNPGGLMLSFVGQPVPAQGEILYSALVYDEGGETGGQLGMKFLDGEQIGYYVFGSEAAEQANLDGEVDVSGNRVTGSFPVDDLGPLGQTGVGMWSASLSINGEDVGMCPGGYGTQPFPR